MGTDLFTLKGVNYLLAVNYVPEVIQLKTTTSQSDIAVLKSTFSEVNI